jgi:hypothetical protein
VGAGSRGRRNSGSKAGGVSQRTDIGRGNAGAQLTNIHAESGHTTSVDVAGSMLEILRADVGPLADELDAIVCCSDLQGVLHGKLLGVAVAELLVDLAERRVLPPSARTGIVLAGDLYSVPAANKRGGYGDVASVWEAFADRFPWIVGVAGNHDDTTNVVGLGTHVRVLDGDSVVVDGLCIGGVGRIIGNKQKPGRRDNSSGSRTSWPRAATSSCCTRGHTATTANTATRQQGNSRRDRERPGPAYRVRPLPLGKAARGASAWPDPQRRCSHRRADVNRPLRGSS